MAVRQLTIPVVPADDDWFLSEAITSAITAAAPKTTADVSNGIYCHTGYPQRVALKTDSATATTVTFKYYSPVGDTSKLVTDTLSVSSAAVTYTTLPVLSFYSLSATAVAGATLKVGFQGYPYYWSGPSNAAFVKSAGLMETYVASTGNTGVGVQIDLGTTGTPAADKISYDADSQTVVYCYPVDGSSNAIGGILTVMLDGA